MIGKYELNNIYNEDSYQAIKNMPDNSVDLVIIDPPYEIETHGVGFHKKSDYCDKIFSKGLHTGVNNEIIDEIVRIQKSVNLYVFCNKNQLLQYFDYFKDYNIDLLVWHKTNPIPTVKNKYLSDLEYIIFIRDSGVKLYGDYSTLSKLFQTTVNKNDKKFFSHPTIKPLNIIKTLIKNSSKQNEIVVDFFLGSGTTAVAAKELNRRYIGFEIDKEYFKIAKDRLNGINANGQTSMFTDFDNLLWEER